jgi:hypothetical protein
MIRTICAALVCLVVGAQAQPVKKIVFLAGPKEHGAPGRHEYEKDLRELAWSLEHASNLKNVKTVVLVGRPPRDLSVFADADAIVIDGNGGWLKTETGMLFPQDQDTDGRTYDAATMAWIKSLDGLIKQKHIGLAVFHYTMWVDNWVGRAQWQDWLRGAPSGAERRRALGLSRGNVFALFPVRESAPHRSAGSDTGRPEEWRLEPGVLGL